MSFRLPFSPPDAQDLLESDDPGLPQRIGKYNIVSRLGEGATSEVFLAVDAFNHRNVAIKRVDRKSVV